MALDGDRLLLVGRKFSAERKTGAAGRKSAVAAIVLDEEDCSASFAGPPKQVRNARDGRLSIMGLVPGKVEHALLNIDDDECAHHFSRSRKPSDEPEPAMFELSTGDRPDTRIVRG